MKNLITILNMHGYDFYIYSAYTIVISTLGLYLFGAIKRNRNIKAWLVNNKLKR